MRSDAIIAGMVGGTIGLLASAASAWMTLSVYRDGEFDVPYLMVVYTLALLATAVLLLFGALSARLSSTPPLPTTFIAAGVTSFIALAAGAGFSFIGISSSGPPMFLLIFVLPPCAILVASAWAGTWFARRAPL